MTLLPRYLTIFLAIFSAACAAGDRADERNAEERGRLIGTLTTDEYQLALRTGCAEGEVSCEQIYAQLQALDSGDITDLSGSTMHTLCADGKSPCRFLGYHLSHENYEYRVLENGQLTIKRCDRLGCEAAYNARGTWQY